MQQMINVIHAFCPQWQDKRETLCSEKDLVKALAFMDQKHYNAIGPLTKSMREQLKLMKSFKEPALVDVALVTQVREAIEFGIETVAFSYFFRHTEQVWLDVENAAISARNVEKMRAELANTGVTPTKEMAALLVSWETGKRMEELQKARGKESLPEEQQRRDVHTAPDAAMAEDAPTHRLAAKTPTRPQKRPCPEEATT